MELGNIAQYGALALAVFSTIVSLVAHSRKETKEDLERMHAALEARASKAETADLFDRMRHAEARLSEMGNEIEHLPDKDAAHRMEMAIARLEGQLEIMGERLKPVSAMATRMQEAMIERASK